MGTGPHSGHFDAMWPQADRLRRQRADTPTPPAHAVRPAPSSAQSSVPSSRRRALSSTAFNAREALDGSHCPNGLNDAASSATPPVLTVPPERSEGPAPAGPVDARSAPPSPLPGRELARRVSAATAAAGVHRPPRYRRARRPWWNCAPASLSRSRTRLGTPSLPLMTTGIMARLC